ncbi:non-specific lipid transfer protein GPI-anchored 5-like [Malania oleifera]|uniref:non-specific lipid transfer protein GPI-anchored 5-like n=1 Tax=Malania oleifera TaxID=397392 RepID=UPI0025AE5E54|nr:non-specific lipid transfer protein GPI-anchored 5-like [Malania oleifera]
MAHKRIEMGLALVLLSLLCTGAMAQSDCTSVLISLAPCLSYLTGNSSTPSTGCCTQLAGVVQSQPKCLCEALNLQGAAAGLNINETLALGLPNACKVQTPPLSSCNAASPANSPSGAPNTPGSIPSEPGLNSAPPADTGSATRTSTKLSMSMLFFLLFAASYASTFATSSLTC